MEQLHAAGWEITLAYLRVLLSWPVIGGAAIFTAGAVFRTEFQSLLRRVASLEFAGAKLVTQKTALEEAAEGTVPRPNEAPAPDDALNGLELDEQTHNRLEAIFQAERVATLTWEYRYMNYYFAPSTQAVLNWLMGTGQPTTIDAYHAHWANRLIAVGEQDAVLVALERHACIQIAGQTINLTDKGKEYAQSPERRVMNIPSGAYLGVVPQAFTL